VVRAGEGRWSDEAEEVFLAHLAATANVRAAARAAGFSTAALYQRRLRDPAFAGRWDEAKGQGAERIDLLLIEAAERSLDPGVCEAAEALPKPTIGEAIQIARMMRVEAAPGRRGAAAPRRTRSAEEARAEILTRIEAIERHKNRARREQGWVQDDEGHWIPPGWTRRGGARPADGGDPNGGG